MQELLAKWSEVWCSGRSSASLIAKEKILCSFLLKKAGGFCYFYEKKSRDSDFDKGKRIISSFSYALYQYHAL